MSKSGDISGHRSYICYGKAPKVTSEESTYSCHYLTGGQPIPPALSGISGNLIQPSGFLSLQSSCRFLLHQQGCEGRAGLKGLSLGPEWVGHVPSQRAGSQPKSSRGDVGALDKEMTTSPHQGCTEHRTKVDCSAADEGLPLCDLHRASWAMMSEVLRKSRFKLPSS